MLAFDCMATTKGSGKVIVRLELRHSCILALLRSRIASWGVEIVDKPNAEVRKLVTEAIAG